MRRRASVDPPDVEGALLGRAAQIGEVLARYGLKELFADKTSPRTFRKERAARLRAALEELGPTFAKLGQILSTRPDLLPGEFIDELSTLQERVTPLSEEQVVAVMEEELGVPWEDVFDWIEPTPLAAGTIGQVHRARLENGDRVVVKVQRPQAGPDIYRDLGLLEIFARKTEGRPAFRQVVDLPAVIEHLSSSLRRELDFRQELMNIERMRAVLEPFSRLAVPGVYRDLSSARLLVLEEVQGGSLREAPPGDVRKEAARQLLESFYQQILNDGFFHADPHPGNLKWWNGTIYFLDLGMVGEVDQHTRELLLLVLMAFWRQDIPFLTDTMLMLSGEDQRVDIDLRALQAELGVLVARYAGASLKDIQLGPVLQGMTEIAARNEVQLPSALALTGKALAQMQLATAELDPHIDPLSVASAFVLRSMSGRMRDRLDGQFLLYEGQKLRLRATRIIEAVERLAGARPGAKLQVQFMGTERLEDTIRNAARRFSLALVAGTCIVATGITADSLVVGRWVPITLGVVGGVLGVGLVLDLLRR